jgi:hypothetical protein
LKASVRPSAVRNRTSRGCAVAVTASRPVGLHPLARLLQNERGRHHQAFVPKALDLPVELLNVEPGRCAGPIRSGYGSHLVFIRERQDGRMPALAEVRSRVEREFIADRRQRQLEAMYARLLDRYR